MTDQNQSRIFVTEVNDTAAETMMIFYCRSGRIDAFLDTKNVLLSDDQLDTGKGPNLMYRVDSQQAKTIPTQGTLVDDEPDATALAFDIARDDIVFAAFKNASSKIVMRVLRREASSLDYTFSTRGFKDALRAVNNCQ
ncbi:hypothetical protein C8263_09175 [Deinococcus arcticus]|uniref:Uncharacterized protein n=2 Tax=Deinococcus arcticus TaxID=2136176 RepID=A0A2T3W8J9_9DEIO|nr:hypothetical protein C8263_09175 [Deinococcus arcticus]